MGKSLTTNNQLLFDPILAKEIGLNEAIVLQQIHYWLEINKKSKKNFHNKKYWTYNSVRNMKTQFPFLSESTIKRTLMNLENKKYIISDTFNKKTFDRTKWYTINYKLLHENFNFINNETYTKPTDKLDKNDDKTPYTLGHYDPIREVNLPQPIPYTTTYTNNNTSAEPDDVKDNTSFHRNDERFYTSFSTEVKSFIDTYMNDYYVQRYGESHPPLKKTQYKKVATILEQYSELGLHEMAEQFFNTVKKSDYNINHFATTGMLDILSERVR